MCICIPAVAVTLPSVLVVFRVEWTTHWKVVLPLIENTVNERALGVEGLFCRYSSFIFTISYSVNDVPLIIHVTGNGVTLWYPQLMITLLPLQTVVFSGGLVIVTVGTYICTNNTQNNKNNVYVEKCLADLLTTV